MILAGICFATADKAWVSPHPRMPKRVDLLPLPTAGEVRHTKEEIKFLEEELERAKRLVITLKETLEEKRGFIAPVRKLNLDILPLIFEFAAAAEWKSPLRIGLVSQLWRETVLRIPRVWKFMDMNYEDEWSVFHLYSERSEPLGLHVRETGHEDYTSLSCYEYQTNRIECFTTKICFDKPFAWPSLKKLVIVGGEGATVMSSITNSLFPCLRHLEVDRIFFESSRDLDLPPLEILAITVYQLGLEICHCVIRACKNSLTLLEVKIGHTFILRQEENVIHLPLLRYLKVFRRGHREAFWPMRLDTPALKTYIEQHEEGSGYASLPKHMNTDSLHYLRVPYFPPLESLQQLRALQLELDWSEVRGRLYEAKSNGPLLPHLRLLQLLSDDIHDLEPWCSILFPALTCPPTVARHWHKALPGEHAFYYPHHAQCDDWGEFPDRGEYSD